MLQGSAEWCVGKTERRDGAAGKPEASGGTNHQVLFTSRRRAQRSQRRRQHAAVILLFYTFHVVFLPSFHHLLCVCRTCDIMCTVGYSPTCQSGRMIGLREHSDISRPTPETQTTNHLSQNHFHWRQMIHLKANDQSASVTHLFIIIYILTKVAKTIKNIYCQFIFRNRC